jgi:hypothetical protein
MKKQTDVMLLIAGLLNAWDDVPNDVKGDPELKRLFDWIRRLSDADVFG